MREDRERKRRIVTALVCALVAAPGPGAAAETAATRQAPEQAREQVQDRSVLAPLAPHSLLLDVARAGDRLVAVGERGHVLYSDDGGAAWTQTPAPTGATLTGVHFAGPERGWAVGHDAVILRTADGGLTWERVHHAPDEQRPLLDVWFADAERGLAIGAYGYLLETADGGDSWHDRTVAEEDFHLNKLAAAAGGALYIAAEAGAAYRSDDGGRSWTEMDTPYEGSFFGVLALGRDALLLGGLRGHLFRSDDAGRTWRRIPTGTDATLTDAVRLDEDTVVVAGMAGTLLVSRDAGASFTLHEREDRLGIAALAPAGGGALVLVGEGGAHRLAGEAW